MFLKHIQILRTMLGKDLGSGTEQGGAIERRDFWCSALVSVIGFFNLATVIAQNSTEQVLRALLILS